KPENIIVTESPTGERIKLIDFGLAIHVGPRPAERVTGHGGTMGTPLYMSPEQCRGKPVDGRSDIYSLGVILFELLVGQPPFVGETPMEIFMKHIFNDPPRPSSFPSERPVPPAFDHVTGLALEKHPSARPQTALEFRRALDQALLTTQALSPDSRSSATLADVGRVARQRALGIATVEQRASEETPDRVIPIVEGDPESTTSLTTLLRHLGFRTEALTAFDASHPLAGIAMIYDIRDDPENALDDLARRFTEGEIEARGLIVVGPDSPFAVIEKALEIGIEDYVPAGRAARLLPRTLRRLLRRRITAD
ncbi:MAG: serine/threonine protein kinase, partial [Myxococcales bacterium]|nr:serine/threonine protein kinase [Myxococcales bacterium]